MNNKIILTDYDGVLCTWLEGFEKFLSDKSDSTFTSVDDSQWDLGAKFGYDRQKMDDLAREFCDSEYIENLNPIEGAVEYITKLHRDYGYKFHIITSLSNKAEAYAYRYNNFCKHFPEDSLYKLTVLPLHARKLNFLETYYKNSGLWWIEDKYENYTDGEIAGLKSILLDYPYNKKQQTLTDRVASNWKEIFNFITGE